MGKIHHFCNKICCQTSMFINSRMATIRKYCDVPVYSGKKSWYTVIFRHIPWYSYIHCHIPYKNNRSQKKSVGAESYGQNTNIWIYTPNKMGIWNGLALCCNGCPFGRKFPLCGCQGGSVCGIAENCCSTLPQLRAMWPTLLHLLHMGIPSVVQRLRDDLYLYLMAYLLVLQIVFVVALHPKLIWLLIQLNHAYWGPVSDECGLLCCR
jgi:hypothetical protein